MGGAPPREPSRDEVDDLEAAATASDVLEAAEEVLESQARAVPQPEKAAGGPPDEEEEEMDISELLAPAKVRIPVEELEIGQTLEGRVDGRWKQLGVFVDVGAENNGLLRVTEMTEGFPGDRIQLRLKKGDNVTVRVLDKTNRGRFSLTMRPGELPRPDPRAANAGDPETFASFLVKDWFDAEVDHMTTWGVFLKVWPSNDKEPIMGLLHRSRFAEGFAEEAAIGKRLKVRVVAADAIKAKIDLTMLDNAGNVSIADEDIVLAPPVLSTQAEEVTAKAAEDGSEDEGEDEDVEEIPKDQRVPVDDLSVGQALEGTVHGFFHEVGVWVDVGAKANGLLRVSEMMDVFPGTKIPFLKGDKIAVRVLDKTEMKGGRKRFSVTMRPGELPRPAKEVSAGDPETYLSFLVKDWFDAEVDHMTTWGAFVKVWPAGGKEPIMGLLHKSRFKDGFSQEIAIGSKIKVRAVSADAIRNRIDLSMLEH